MTIAAELLEQVDRGQHRGSLWSTDVLAPGARMCRSDEEVCTVARRLVWGGRENTPAARRT